MKALTDATNRWPNRKKSSDGCCGDASHAARKSDHNPDASGYAHAFDLTHDPVNECDCHAIADLLATSGDRRIKYIIWNHKIWYPEATGTRPKGWSKYTGPNPHTTHLHVSIKSNTHHDLAPWPWSPDTQPEVRPVLRRGDRGVHVELLQCKLGIDPDGIFGYGTERAVKKFQGSKGLEQDGIVGAATWAALTIN